MSSTLPLLLIFFDFMFISGLNGSLQAVDVALRDAPLLFALFAKGDTTDVESIFGLIFW